MGIKNLKLVYWKFNAFVCNLREESKITEQCSELRKDVEFLNVSHRAKQEVENLILSKNTQIIDRYREAFKVCFEILDEWIKKNLKDKFKMNTINMTLVNISEVYKLLVEYKMNQTITDVSNLESAINLKKIFQELDTKKTRDIKTPEQKGVYDFFDEVIESEISDIEIYNYIEKATNNFDEVKTKMILKDLDLYLMASKMELENDYNLNDLVGKDKQYKSIKEIPFTYGKNLTTGELDKTIKHYDYEKLFYPHHFFNLYRLRKLIISNQKTVTSRQTNDLLTDTQKKIIDKLVNRGFKDVHIYRFLKDEKQFITITQKEFNTYMIENYQREYKPEKRITSITDISIPRELSIYFDEITA